MRDASTPLITLILLSIILTACGGGGSDSGSSVAMSSQTDTDGDGTIDDEDLDDDNDGQSDNDETACGSDPLDANSTIPDTDEDGLLNCFDNDMDGDFILNSKDAFELDPSESKDDDGDGIGNNSDPDSTIYYVVTEEVHDNLATELQRFMEDVSADTNTTPVLLTASDSIADIRAQFEEAYKNAHLKGAFLIGNVPFFTIKNVDSIFQYVSDHPFRAFSCPYQPDDIDPSVLWVTSHSSKLYSCLPDIWVSRIKPTSSGYFSTEQVRTYLNKNNRNRQEHHYWQQSMSYIDATPRETQIDFSEDAQQGFLNHPLYTPGMVDVQQPLTASSQMSTWIDALESNHEIVNLNVHGHSLGIEFQGEGSDDNIYFNSSELNSVSIHSKVIEMTSCSVGNFSNDDYFAGKLLFSGDSLLVTAFTIPALMADSRFENDINFRFKAYGWSKSYADNYRFSYDGEPTHFYGDPTIALRDQGLPRNRPRLIFNGEHFTESFDSYIDMGSALNDETKRLDIEIANTGNDDLVLYGNYWKSNYTNVNGGIIHGTSGNTSATGFIFTLEGPDRDGFSYELIVAPGESEMLTITFHPDANNDKSLESGAEYTGVFMIGSNDPVSPGILLHVSGVQTKE